MENRLNFSQRIGIAPSKKPIQIGSINEDLRNTLWNLLKIHYWDIFDRSKYDLGRRNDFISGSNLWPLFQRLWLDHFKEPIDDIPELFHSTPRSPSGLSVLKNHFFNAEWNKVYEFVEFVSLHGPKESQLDFISKCNIYLEKENSGYRFVNGIIIEISSSEEIGEIEKAIEAATPYYGVRQHLKTAITLLSDRQSPDYRNSIKESISAVEALCKKITTNDNATLGQAIKFLEKKRFYSSRIKKCVFFTVWIH